MDLLQAHLELPLLFFGIAILYGSLGFGGGSSYLGLLLLTELNWLLVRPLALICNITVVGGSTWLYHSRQHLKWRKTLPLVVLSVPMAFLGGSLRVREEVFSIVLGFTLLLAGILVLLRPMPSEGEEGGRLWWLNALIGGAIGFLAGFVGIGGGIFLAPFLHLIRWDRPKTIAATASLFILLNSMAGLLAQVLHVGMLIDWVFAGSLVLAVFLGGQIGARLGTGIFPQRLIKVGTAILVLFVGLSILWDFI